MSNKVENDEMLPEYDFSKGMRGKYAKHFKDTDRLVSLDADVIAVFPDSEAVNTALRGLIKAARGSVRADFSKAS